MNILSYIDATSHMHAYPAMAGPPKCYSVLNFIGVSSIYTSHLTRATLCMKSLEVQLH